MLRMCEFSIAMACFCRSGGGEAEHLQRLEQVLLTVLQNDNEKRRAADRTILDQFEKNRDMFVVALMKLMRGSKNADVETALSACRCMR